MIICFLGLTCLQTACTSGCHFVDGHVVMSRGLLDGHVITSCDRLVAQPTY